MISVASPVFPQMKFRYKGEEYSQRMVPQFEFPSIHLNGRTDNFARNLTIQNLFTEESNAKVVEYNEGHRFPRAIPDVGYQVLKNFVLEQFVAKNGTEQGFDVD